MTTEDSKPTDTEILDWMESYMVGIRYVWNKLQNLTVVQWEHPHTDELQETKSQTLRRAVEVAMDTRTRLEEEEPTEG